MEQLTSLQAGILLTATEFVGDYGAKVDNPVLLYGGYNALAWELRGMLRNKPLALVNGYWDGISNVMTMALGYMLGEQLTTNQWIGAAMISGGLFLLTDGPQTL